MRMTLPTALALHAIDRGILHGFDIVEATGLRAGTVYPILRRLEGNGLLASSWERASRARAENRPPRRNYRLTPAGVRALKEALQRYPGVERMLEGGDQRGRAVTA